MHDNELWDGVLSSLQKKLDSTIIETWLKPAKIYTNRGDGVVIALPNKFFKNWVEKHYLKPLTDVLREDYGIEFPIKFTIEAVTEKPQTKQNKTKIKKETVSNQPSLLYAEYTFENFVNGESNSFAYAAALAVAEGNFNIYNPLYIYGSTGLGKTHLIHAISNKIKHKFPKLNIMYMDAETFTSEIINVFAKYKGEHQQTQVDMMKARFLAADVFVMDDIQFLKDRQKTLEFFFNIFNTFQMQQKQVIITSDESPQEINMADRMKSRFASGFQAEIVPPTTEERVAILRKKAEELNTPITDHTAMFLAENTATSNNRELIAALKRVALYASIEKKEIDETLIIKSLKDAGLLKKETSIMSPLQLITIVAETFNIKISEMVSKKKSRNIVTPRQVAMYLLKKKLNLSLKEIGSHFGNRDHSTVKHSIDTIGKKIENDSFLNELTKKIEKKL